jgi:Transposase DDE domain group 1
VLIRADSGGGTHEFLSWLSARSRRLRYSVGMTITTDIQDAIVKVPAQAWTPACDGDGQVRDGAWVAEITGMLDLSSWPAGMRVIVRKERPHPGAQLRFTGIDGHRFTCFATDTNGGQLAGLELRTGAGPSARTGSCAPRTPGCATCRARLRAEPDLVPARRAGL